MARYGFAKGVVLVCCLVAGAAFAESADQMVERGNAYWAENKPDLAEQQFKQIERLSDTVVYLVACGAQTTGRAVYVAE